MIRFIACAALLLTPSIGSAQGACLTRQEVGSLMVFVAPSVIEAAAAKCAPSLPEASFLRYGYREMVSRLRAENAANGAELKAMFGKVAGEKLPEGVKDETFRTMIEEMIGAEFGNDLKVKDCAAVDELTAALAPLPARNIAAIFGSILALSEGDGKKPPFQMCKGQ